MPKILIEIDAPEAIETNEQQIKILIKDALHDFVRVRTPNIQYVETRYPTFTAEQKKAKRQEVANRCGIACYLQNSPINVLI